jgi:hypothetical protein
VSRTDLSAARAAEVNNLHKKFVSAMRKGAQIAFEIGKHLRDIWGSLDANASWPEWCGQNLAFDVSTANKYLRIYENFKDNPKLLNGQTMSGALKLLAAPKEEKQKTVEYGGEEKYKTPWERYFELPPLSRKAELINHRFEIPNNHELYLVRRGFDYPVKIAEVLAPGAEDDRLKTAHRGMLEGIQIALEMYYQEVERLEAIVKTTEGGKKNEVRVTR